MGTNYTQLQNTEVMHAIIMDSSGQLSNLLSNSMSWLISASFEMADMKTFIIQLCLNILNWFGMFSESETLHNSASLITSCGKNINKDLSVHHFIKVNISE